MKYSRASLIAMLEEDRSYVWQALATDRRCHYDQQRKQRFVVRAEKLTEIIGILAREKEQANVNS